MKRTAPVSGPISGATWRRDLRDLLPEIFAREEGIAEEITGKVQKLEAKVARLENIVLMTRPAGRQPRQEPTGT